LFKALEKDGDDKLSTSELRAKIVSGLDVDAWDEFFRLACVAAEADSGDKVGKRWCLRVPFGMYADDAVTKEEVDGGARERHHTDSIYKEERNRDAHLCRHGWSRTW
jgi:hypothetical protein